jgi:peptidoglycan/xylan/chitin deacetylase (PgdA/CDA1 family)
MADPSVHPSLAKRALRVFSRVLGVPLGIAAMLALRLTDRKAGVAVMYHSVDHRFGDPGRELVPPHEAGLFEAQIRFLAKHYRVVPAADQQVAVRARRRGQRFPVANTFDDDLACHESISLPILRRAGVSATFFLSGASLDRPFSFHFERLQRAYDAEASDLPGIVSGGASGVATPTSVHALALVMVEMPPEELDSAAERLLAVAGPDPETAGIRREAVRALSDAGMTVGFHTLRHDALTGLADSQLADAMEVGRAELAEAAGAPVDVIGYPGGRCDQRVADAARAAGFRVGYSTERAPVTPASDPLLLGRIGPSLHTVGALALEAAFTLRKRESGRPSPAPGRAPS